MCGDENQHHSCRNVPILTAKSYEFKDIVNQKFLGHLFLLINNLAERGKKIRS